MYSHENLVACTLQGQDLLGFSKRWRDVNQGLKVRISADIRQGLLYKQLSKVTKLDFDLQVYLRAEAAKGPEYSLAYLENAMEMSLERDRETKRAQEISASVASGGKPKSGSAADAKAKAKAKSKSRPKTPPRRPAAEATAEKPTKAADTEVVPPPPLAVFTK